MSDADTLLVIMGSAQDGGVPQLGMHEAGLVERTAASAAVLGSGGEALLLDASPEVRRQQRALLEYPHYAARHGNAFDGILLTHGRTAPMVRWLNENGWRAEELTTKYVGERVDTEIGDADSETSPLDATKTTETKEELDAESAAT